MSIVLEMSNYGLMAAHGRKWSSQLNIVFISHGTMASRLAVQLGAILLWLACFGLTMQSGTELRRLSIRCYIAIYIYSIAVACCTLYTILSLAIQAKHKQSACAGAHA